MNNKTIYFPGLNGIRAFAAIAVVLYHITAGLEQFKLNQYILGTNANGHPQELSMGPFAVSIFFALSGFLITFLLQVEKEKQPVDIKKFYLRRILRIWPLYYLYLVVAVIVILAFREPLNIPSVIFYIFYAANVPFLLGTGHDILLHYWSLGVEEQFYLFWPWINKKAKSLLTAAIVLALSLICIKVTIHILYPKSVIETIFIDNRFQCMMIGGIGAILYKRQHKLFLKIADNKLTQLACWFAIFLLIINRFHVASIIDDEIMSTITVFLIIGQINVRNRIINLEVPILNFIGRLSYGIYVIHPLVIFLFQKALGPANIYTPAKYAMAYIGVLAITILLAHLSYTYFEQYFLKLKKKFEVVKSSANKTAVV